MGARSKTNASTIIGKNTRQNGYQTPGASLGTDINHADGKTLLVREVEEGRQG